MPRAAAVAPPSAAVRSGVAAPPAGLTSAARGAAPGDAAYVPREELACSANSVSLFYISRYSRNWIIYPAIS